MKKTIISTLVLASVLAINVSAHAAETKPYCTAANSHAHWWTWTKNSMESACYTAMIKTFKQGKKINALYRGHYKVSGLNKATLLCREGKKKVIGEGAEVFTNAANMRSQMGWKNGCVVVIKN